MLPVKVLLMLVNVVLIFLLLKTGFQIWKVNQGNILMAEIQAFKISFKNVWFWVLFQSYILLLFFSAFKLLVTIDQKKNK